MNGVGVVLGGASCLFDDVAELRAMLDPAACTIIAVNDAGFRWPGRIDHWATLHPEELGWRKARRQKYEYPGGYRTWTRNYPMGMEKMERLCDQVIGAPWTDGSSGFLGVGVAWTLGLRRIVLCGVPMDGGGRLERMGGWVSHGTFRPAWKAASHPVRAALRSMSGWTRDQFGVATPEWLDTGLFPSATPACSMFPDICEHRSTEE